MRQLVWSPRSQQDLIDIAEYYDQFDQVLAEEMIDRVSVAPTPLLDFPEIGTLTSMGARKWLVPHTPYLLLYDITDDAVEIAAVCHVRSNWPR